MQQKYIQNVQLYTYLNELLIVCWTLEKLEILLILMHDFVIILSMITELEC